MEVSVDDQFWSTKRLDVSRVNHLQSKSQTCLASLQIIMVLIFFKSCILGIQFCKKKCIKIWVHTIEMDFDLSIRHVTDGRHSDKDWIPPVDYFDFHTFSELRRIVFGIFESPLGYRFTSCFF